MFFSLVYSSYFTLAVTAFYSLLKVIISYHFASYI